ncbi:MAG: branched-chain amino acid ABC transporter permease [Clostridia bacterium]|nr:branched-chain amino acid ABC transporter permease [Clostridia bacterium]
MADGIMKAATVAAAIATICGLLVTGVKWYLKQDAQTEDIEALKKENSLICYGLSAALDGLMQLGANHTVPLAKDKLDKHLNQKAHGQER